MANNPTAVKTILADTKNLTAGRTVIDWANQTVTHNLSGEAMQTTLTNAEYDALRDKIKPMVESLKNIGTVVWGAWVAPKE